MSRPAQPKEQSPIINIYSFFPPITITSLFPVSDPSFLLFITAGSVIVLIAITESILSYSDIALVLNNISRFLFPILGFGAIFWLLTNI